MSFSSLGLSSRIARALQESGYSEPTPIQNELIPAILQGRDILASAQTGTGKTAAFVLPLLDTIAAKQIPDTHTLRALIVVPTRELARQIGKMVERYAQFLPLRSLTISGGSQVAAQVKQIEAGMDLLIGTPGRIVEHLNQKSLDLRSVEYFVLDEADTVLDMGFLAEVSQIIQSLKPKRQNIFISATISAPLKALSRELLHRPLTIEMAPFGTLSKLIAQRLYPVAKERKTELLSYLIGSRNYRHVLVFVRKKADADLIAEELNLSGLETAVLHGEKTPGARKRALSDFLENKIRVLVATDIVARGLDFKELDIVINYDIPHVTQDFIHRVGRTGRAGREGLAITLHSPDEAVALGLVERMLGSALKREVIPGYELAKEPTQKEIRFEKNEKQTKTMGAFGKKKQTQSTKKRKTTKRDGYASVSAAVSKQNPKSRRGSKK